MNIGTASSIGHPAIPRPRRRLPLLGDLLSFNVSMPIQSLVRYTARLGPIYEFKIFGVRYIVAGGADIVVDLNDESRFCKHVGPQLEALRIPGGDGLFTAYNDEPNWRKAHALLMPAFTQPAMRRYHSVMVDTAAELIARWDALTDPAGAAVNVDVTADTTRVTLETIARCAAGYSFKCLQSAEQHPFGGHMVAALCGSGQLGLLRSSFAPRFVSTALERKVRRHSAYLHSVADEIVATRRAQPQNDYDDLLSIMLAPGDDGEPALDEANIRYQLINFLIAGHETTSGAVSFALYYLSRHPEEFARARAEVDQVWQGRDRPDFEHIARLRYVRRVLDESMRLHPTVPGYFRAAREDTLLAGTYPMRKGEWVVALTGPLHRDPRWTGPGLKGVDEFDPDRFTPDRVKNRPGHLYKPFGTGERSCIGRQFALHEAVLVLGTLIRRYDFITDPGYELKIQERVTMMPKDFRLGLRLRTQ